MLGLHVESEKYPETILLFITNIYIYIYIYDHNYTSVHRNIIHNCKKLKQFKYPSTDEWINIM